MRPCRRRERELRALLRAPEEGAHNLAAFIAAHGAELGLDDSSDADEVLAPRLRARLEDRRLAEQRAALPVTLRQLRAAARWDDQAVLLPPAPLFRLASTAGEKYIRLVGDNIDTIVRRRVLHRAGVVLRPFRDVSAVVDVEGVHLHWGSCGRLNLIGQQVKEPTNALAVLLPPRCVPRSMPVLLGDVLAELGLGV